MRERRPMKVMEQGEQRVEKVTVGIPKEAGAGRYHLVRGDLVTIDRDTIIAAFLSQHPQMGHGLVSRAAQCAHQP